jgi:hypothetical protein
MLSALGQAALANRQSQGVSQRADHKRASNGGPCVLTIATVFLKALQMETALTHVVLNPTRVSYYTANSRTFWSIYTPRKRRVDIEVAIRWLDRNSDHRQPCYPQRSWPDDSDSQYMEAAGR